MRGEDQADLALRQTPSLTNFPISSLAMASRSAGSGRDLEKTGRPVVGMECLTPCLGFLILKAGWEMEGNLSSSL